MDAKRETIGKLIRNNLRNKDIVDIMGKDQVDRKFVSKVRKRIEATGSAAPRIRKRQKTVRTQPAIKRTRSKIARNPRRSIRAMARQEGMAASTMFKIVRKDLKCKAYKFQKKAMLSNTAKENRLKKCRALLRRHDLGTVIFSDEKIFTVEPVVNRNNDRILAPSLEAIPEGARTIHRRQHPASVMVWMAASSSGKCPLVFVPEGVKINQKTYQDLILEPILKPWITSTFPNEPYVFQQDSVPAHAAKSTQEWLKRNLRGFLSKEEWPASSPDLNVFDFCIFGMLQEKVNRLPHMSVEKLKAALIKEWADFPMDTVRAACASWPNRLRRVVEAGGGHIE